MNKMIEMKKLEDLIAKYLCLRPDGVCSLPFASCGDGDAEADEITFSGQKKLCDVFEFGPRSLSTKPFRDLADIHYCVTHVCTLSGLFFQREKEKETTSLSSSAESKQPKARGNFQSESA